MKGIRLSYTYDEENPKHREEMIRLLEIEKQNLQSSYKGYYKKLRKALNEGLPKDSWVMVETEIPRTVACLIKNKYVESVFRHLDPQALVDHDVEKVFFRKCRNGIILAHRFKERKPSFGVST